jgi:hypothetical protein
MTAFIVGRNTVNAAGEPLHRAVYRLRLEIEGQMVSRGRGDDAEALQVIGLLLQLEGLSRAAAGAPPLDQVAPAPSRLAR